MDYEINENYGALKPCPFCGRNKHLKFRHIFNRHYPDGLFSIRCNRCNIRGRYALTEGGAVINWNQRNGETEDIINELRSM